MYLVQYTRKYSTRNDRFQHYHKVPHRFELSLNIIRSISVKLMYLLFRVWFIKFTHFLLITWCIAWLVFLVRNVPLQTGLKLARYNDFVATPSIFQSLILKQIDLYGKTIITHRLNFIMILFFWAIGINIMCQCRHNGFSFKSNFSPYQPELWK